MKKMAAKAVAVLCGALLAVLAPGAAAQNAHTVPLVLAADNAGLTGFVRIVNRSFRPGTVRIHAYDDTGRRFGPVALALGAREAVNINSRDLERGNASKGLPSGIGDGEGDWWLYLNTALVVIPYAYIRTADEFVTSMHDISFALSYGEEGSRHRVAFFNPGSNTRQVSLLRLSNPGARAAEVTISGEDDEGLAAPGGDVRIVLPAGASRTLTAQELESGGDGFDGRLGDGTGKWRLHVTSNGEIEVMNLLRSPTGHLSNLSSDPRVEGRGGDFLPLVLPADSPHLTSFVRIVNLSSRPGTVMIDAYDDTGRDFGPVTLALGAREAVNINSRDLERGNASKGLPSGIGDGEGNWRLGLYPHSAIDFQAYAYIRSEDGFVTGMHDLAHKKGQSHPVAFFNPGSNIRQVSLLRLSNPGARAAEVTISGEDDEGLAAPGGDVRIVLPAGASRTLTAQELESGGDGFDGRLGDGTGKWRLYVASNGEIEVMNLLRSPTGHLSNLSTCSYIPSFQTSDYREYFSINSMLHEHLCKPLHQRTQTMLRPVRDVLVQHQPLPEQRMRAILHRVRPQPPVIAQALPCRAQQGQ